MDPDKMENSGKKSRFEKMKERMQREHTVELEEWRRKVEQLELKLQRQHERNEGQDEAGNMESNCMERRAKAVLLEKTVEELKVQIESTKADSKKEIDCYKEKLKEEQRKYIDLESKMISSEMNLMAEESKNTVLNVECESAQLKLKEEQIRCDAKETELKNVHAVFQAKQTCDFLLMEVMEATEVECDKRQHHITLMKEAMDVLQQELHTEQSTREKMAIDIQDLRECISRTMTERERERDEKEAQWQEKKLWHQVRVELVERRLSKMEQETEKATFAVNLAEEKVSVANSCLASTVIDSKKAAQGWLTLLKLQREQQDKQHATTTNTLLQHWQRDSQQQLRNVELEWSNQMAGLTEKIRQIKERHQSTQEQSSSLGCITGFFRGVMEKRRQRKQKKMHLKKNN